MMKRYIKTPLKYALPLLFIGALVLVSISGCTSPATTSPSPSVSNVPTGTPTAAATQATPTAATPAATASFDPLLAKFVPTLKTEYGGDAVTQRAKDDISFDAVYVTFESNGRTTTAEIRNEGSTDAASSLFKSLSTGVSGDVPDIGSNTHFGQQAATVALGHAPTTVNDAYLKGTGESAGVDNEYIQYDQFFIMTTVTQS
jgi:hypothetical protein